MSLQEYLQRIQPPFTWGFAFRVLVKALILFIVLNLLFAWLQPATSGNVTVYNTLVPGRLRLPFGQDERAYNLSLNDLDLMLASHVVSQPKAEDEFRLFLIGDSSVWGVLLRPEETLAGVINEMGLPTEDGRRVVAYNLGHPIMSLTKDALILQEAMQYEPDMIVWLTTLESFPAVSQSRSEIVEGNPDKLAQLQSTQADSASSEDFFSKTLIGQREELADWLRHEIYGFLWGATGIDQYYPDEITLRRNNFLDDTTWYGFDVDRPFVESDLAFEVISAGHGVAGDVPLILVNEPIFQADGENSDLRYNFWYPRWAYDSYREIYGRVAQENGWEYVDLWDLIAPEEFTDSPVHLTPAASQILAERLVDIFGPILER